MTEPSSSNENAENVYAPPAAQLTVTRTVKAPLRERFIPEVRGAAKFLLFSFVGVVALFGLAAVVDPRQWPMVFALGFAACAAVFFIAFLRAAVGLFVGASSSAEPALNGFTAFLLLCANGFMTFFGGFLALFAAFGFARGRQIRSLGRVLLPPVEDSDAWTHLFSSLDVPADVRNALAARWRWNGQTEHASVAAFAQLTLDLMALGAPPALIHAANRDAKDEIRHTELCFSLARAIDGREASPGPFPQAQRSRVLPQVRTLALARLAVDSLIDGALHEGLSARIVARLARQCPEPTIRAVLSEIAADEGRHAAHGWDVVEWCLAEGGEAVASALRGAITALPLKVQTDLPEPARFGAWERWGIHGTAMEAEEHALARESIVRRVEKLTATKRAA
jgi:hypothetical protein